jgi:hypothetical protein
MMEEPFNSEQAPSIGTPTREEIAAYIQDQINAVRSQLQAPAVQPIRVKPAKPKAFAAERGSDPDVWLFQFEQYADLVGLTDNEKVRLAATFLEGPAAIWWRSKALELRAQQPPHNVLSWDAFKQQLIQQFKPVDSAKMARDRLAELKQVGSVSKYNTDFNRLVLEAGNVGPIEALDRYIRGLKPEIRMEVELANVGNIPQAQAKAQRVDSITWQARSIGKSNYPSMPTTNGYAPMDISAIKTAEASPQEAPSDSVNAITRRWNRPRAQQHAPPMSREEYQRCRQNGLCLNCKKPGHTARFCVDKPTDRFSKKPTGNERTR